MDKRYFSFFESYYKSFKGLSPKVIGEIVLAMGAFYFDDEEIELKNVSKNIFELIRPVLESSKKKSVNGAKGGAPMGNSNAAKTSKEQAKNNQTTSKKQAKTSDKEKEKDKGIGERNKEIGEKEKKTPSESKKRTMTEIVQERNLDPVLESKILEWLKYKAERREAYKETGLNSLLTEVQNNVNKYGLNPVINCINKSMGRNYAGIIFELVEKGNGDNRASTAANPKIHNFSERNNIDYDDLEKRFARN